MPDATTRDLPAADAAPPAPPGPDAPAPGRGDPAPQGFAADAPTGTSSEVTRLMCLGAYLDRVYRRIVLGRLVEDARRVVAPSYGFDAEPVVAHCLRADAIDEEFHRRLSTARVVSVVVLTGVLLLLAAGWAESVRFDRVSAWAAVALVLVLLALCVRVGVHFLPGDTGRDAVALAREADTLLMPWLVRRAHRERLKRILARELSEETFTGAVPIAHVPSKHVPLLRAIAREQYSALVPYRSEDPFLGAGGELHMWSIALELREAGADRSAPASPLDERVVVDLIRPQLESLTLSAAEDGRDRLGGLEIAECVYLPGTLPHGVPRSRLPVGGPEDARVADHLRAAVGEGGEQRRHFLRIRVAGWDEQVVVTVFVRVHTQGGILLLEIVPYLLGPLEERFRIMDGLVDALTSGVDVDGGLDQWMAHDTGLRKALGDLLPTARSAGEASAFDDGDMRVRGPVFSLREHVDGGKLSHFQRMDVIRYVKTLGLRIAEGVDQALAQAGYETEEFRQQVVNVGEGAVFIGGSMNNGAIATGRGASAQDHSTRSAPQG